MSNLERTRDQTVNTKRVMWYFPKAKHSKNVFLRFLYPVSMSAGLRILQVHSLTYTYGIGGVV